MFLGCMPVIIKEIETSRIQIVDIKSLYKGYFTVKRYITQQNRKDHCKQVLKIPLPPIDKILVWSLNCWTPVKSLTC